MSVCMSVCLCLGVGSFTIVDGQTVTADDAGNKLVMINTLMLLLLLLMMMMTVILLIISDSIIIIINFWPTSTKPQA